MLKMLLLSSETKSSALINTLPALPRSEVAVSIKESSLRETDLASMVISPPAPVVPGSTEVNRRLLSMKKEPSAAIEMLPAFPTPAAVVVTSVLTKETDAASIWILPPLPFAEALLLIVPSSTEKAPARLAIAIAPPLPFLEEEESIKLALILPPAVRAIVPPLPTTEDELIKGALMLPPAVKVIVPLLLWSGRETSFGTEMLLPAVKAILLPLPSFKSISLPAVRLIVP